MGKHQCGEWCDEHQRKECDALIPHPDRFGMATNCGKPTSWRAPLHDERFPLAYCAEHAPPPVSHP